MAASTTTHLLPVIHAFIDRPGNFLFFFLLGLSYLDSADDGFASPPEAHSRETLKSAPLFFILVIIEEGQFIYQRINYNFIT